MFWCIRAGAPHSFSFGAPPPKDKVSHSPATAMQAWECSHGEGEGARGGSLNVQLPLPPPLVSKTQGGEGQRTTRKRQQPALQVLLLLPLPPSLAGLHAAPPSDLTPRAGLPPCPPLATLLQWPVHKGRFLLPLNQTFGLAIHALLYRLERLSGVLEIPCPTKKL